MWNPAKAEAPFTLMGLQCAALKWSVKPDEEGAFNVNPSQATFSDKFAHENCVILRETESHNLTPYSRAIVS
jgi:hypothetical protein